MISCANMTVKENSDGGDGLVKGNCCKVDIVESYSMNQGF